MSTQPYLKVVRGAPDDVELAALTAVVAGLATARGGDAGARPRRSAWADRSRLVRTALSHGPGAWRSSALPR
ncbi:acyl-CoA carboxylase subunit epsilon [Saccharothrix australiensis]|uniref:Acyl-CoA carboxylase epsilon subunit-like protein n=1 Tax=Saccharothrix australiensis TaxID=2072 RepID=A0A495W721_9PSEU|nr:acyl-CoA carboxylase subunit epsilon [Saccharothrix australiensis]RKT57531.1 acyl-CoA carboxylase epsilon subunit-like protein [Saccharothrix australiensis]